MFCWSRLTLALVMVVTTIISSSARAAETYEIDMSHTSVVFAVSHAGFSYTYGRFNRGKGSVVWDAANPSASRFDMAIEVASVDTNDAKRDEHLRGPDFFNANQFPAITFRSKQVTPTPQGIDVVGDLTLHGVTKEVTLPLRKLGEGKSPLGDQRLGFHTEYRLNRSDYGMNQMVPMIGDNIAITISFEAKLK